MLNLHTKSRTRETRLDTFSKVGIFSLSLLAAATITYIYSPVLGTHANESAEESVYLDVAGVVGIRTNVSELDLTASSGSFVSGTVNVDVTSNSFYGYTLSLEDADNNTNLASTAVSDVVSSSFSGSKTSSAMADNSWGYSINNTDFYALPTLGYPVALKRTSSSMTTAYETTPVYFGVKVGMNLPATTYTDIVKFTAYVNGVDREPLEKSPNVDDNPHITINDITTMQEMRPTICLNSAIGDSATLTDTRDNNTYTVKKLKDGKCWMTDNLRIINQTITSADSDVTKDYTIPASSLEGFQANDSNSAYLDETYGGYYSWYTASAGSSEDPLLGDGTINLPSSICPKGWRLPTGGTGAEFKQLADSGYETYELMMGEPGFKPGGMAYDGRMTLDDGTFAYYWSSTAQGGRYDGRNSYRSRYFALFNNYVYSEYFGYTNIGGLNIHCIAR